MTTPSPRFGLIVPGDSDPVDPGALNSNTTLLDTLINAGYNGSNPNSDGVWNWSSGKILTRYNSSTSASELLMAGTTSNKGTSFNYKNSSQVTIAGGAGTNYAQLCVSADLMSISASSGNPYCKITGQGALAILGSASAGITVDVFVYIGSTDVSSAPVGPAFTLGAVGGSTKIQLSTSNIGKRCPFYLSTVLDLFSSSPSSEFVSLNFSYDTSQLPGTASIGLTAPDSALSYSQMWVHSMGVGDI